MSTDKALEKMKEGEEIFPELNNYMEVVVYDLLDHVLGDLDICQCEICKADIVAIALNNLPPKYVVTKQGQLYTKLNTLQQQFDVDVISAITKAAEIVGESPRH